MSALFKNFVGGILTANLLEAGTTMTSPALGSVPAIVAPDTMTVVLDPDGLVGAPEIVLITSHAVDSPTATVVRAQEGTVARDHPARTDWVHSFTAGWVSSLTGGGGTGSGVTAQPEPPSSPEDYELWLDTDESAPVTSAGVFTPSAKVFHSAAQSIPSATGTTLNFDTEAWDNNGMHNIVTNNSRLTVTQPGLYLIGGMVELAANATGVRQLYIRKNATTHLAIQMVPNGAAAIPVRLTTSVMDSAVAGDYYEIQVYQDSGAPLDSLFSAGRAPHFWIHGVTSS